MQIIKEVTDLIETTKTLTPLSTTQVKALSTLYWLIGTTSGRRKVTVNRTSTRREERHAATS